MVFLPRTVSAQKHVIDLANLAKNAQILVENIAMVKIMLDNIAKNPGEWEDAIPLIEKLNEILEQGEALSYSDPNLAEEFEAKFPGYKISDAPWYERTELWANTQLHTLRNVIESANKQNQDFKKEQILVASMLEKSNLAVGQMQALQQGNALSGANNVQLLKLRQLLMTQINADSVYRAAEISRRAEVEAKGRAWISAAPKTLKPISSNDSRGIGDLEFINPLK